MCMLVCIFMTLPACAYKLKMEGKLTNMPLPPTVLTGAERKAESVSPDKEGPGRQAATAAAATLIVIMSAFSRRIAVGLRL